MRIRTVKDSKSFDKYLKSKSTEELIYSSSNINNTTNYQHLNREITFELPNEFLDNENKLLIDPNKLEDEFIKNLEEKFNITISDYTLVIHNPEKEQKNLHCHFLFNSYTEKIVVDKSKPKILTTDKYFYLKSGKVMKDKNKYDESNPNHIYLAAGSKFIDFEQAKEITKDFDDMDKKLQFQIRREVMANYQINKNEEYKWIMTNDFDYSKSELKKRVNSFNDYLVNTFNNRLEVLSFDKKYITRKEGSEMGLKSQIKHNIRGNRTPDDVGIRLIDKNKGIRANNNSKIKKIYGVVKEKVIDTFEFLNSKRKKREEEQRLIDISNKLFDLGADKFDLDYDDEIEEKISQLFFDLTYRQLDWYDFEELQLAIELVKDYTIEEEYTPPEPISPVKKKKKIKL